MTAKWKGLITIVAILMALVTFKVTRTAPLLMVETENASPHEIKASVLASGNLVYEEQALLSPEVIGKVTYIDVHEGDIVNRGQIVLHLDDETYRAEIAQQEAAVRQQRINIEHQDLNLQNQLNQFRRKDELHQKKMIPDQQLDDSHYAVEMARVDLRNSRESLEQAEAVLKQYRERLEKTKIRAPISGTVTALDIKIGETAVASQVGIAGSSLMTIANTSTIMAELNVDEADIARIKLGQEVSIHAAAFPDIPIKGHVQKIPLSLKKNESYVMQGGTSLARNYSIKVKFESIAGLILRPGMTCRAEIYTATSGESLAIPIQAVLSNNDETVEVEDTNNKPRALIKSENYVFVAKDGVAVKRIVMTGISDDNLQEILSGIKTGESIITGPYKVLRHLTTGDGVKLHGKL
jgi:HlyD family secretion protein